MVILLWILYVWYGDAGGGVYDAGCGGGDGRRDGGGDVISYAEMPHFFQASKQWQPTLHLTQSSTQMLQNILHTLHTGFLSHDQRPPAFFG